MGMCRSWRFWTVLGAVLVGVALIAPGSWSRLLPLAAFAACPLSMLVMGVGMARMGRRDDDRRDVVVTDAPRRKELVR